MTDRVHRLFSAPGVGPDVHARIRALSADDRVMTGADLAALLPRFEATDIPADGRSVEAYFDYLFDEVVPHSVGVGAARFVGHMATSLPSFVFPLSELMTALNQNVVKLETSGAFTLYERQAIGMLHRLLYGREEGFYRRHLADVESALGTLTSGGTLANIAALWCARNRAFPRSAEAGGVSAVGWPRALRDEGVDGACVIASSLVHYSVRKAVDLLGIGQRQLIKVPVDERGRMPPSALRRALEEARARNERVIAIVALAGATETGSVDPLDEIAAIAEAFDVHLHVDAAWGGPVAFSREHRGLLAGIERADSITMDAHKQLYAPMGLGLVLFREPDTVSAIEQEADYIIRRGSWDLGRKTLEGSRPGMALFLHAGLHVIGRSGYEALIDAGIARAAALASMVREDPAFELLTEPTMNIVNYRYVPLDLRARVPALEPLDDAENARIDGLNQRVQQEQSARGNGFISRTRLFHTRHGASPGVATLRAVLANPRTRDEDLRAVLDEQREIGDGLEEPAR